MFCLLSKNKTCILYLISAEVCKSVTVTDKEETTVKTYENEGDEFEFPSWNELDCADGKSFLLTVS